MSGVAKKRATYADLFDIAEGVRAEILGGDIVVAPARLPKHSKAQGGVRSFIGNPYDDDGFGGPGGWWIFLEVDVALSENDIVRPDVAGWRRERLKNPGDRRPIDVVPDWVCEVLSPSTAAYDRVAKSALYAEHGVEHDWIVDPEERTLEVFARLDGGWRLAGAYDDTAAVRVAPFEEVELAVGRLFLPRHDRG